MIVELLLPQSALPAELPRPPRHGLLEASHESPEIRPNLARRAKEMDMVRHDHVAADLPPVEGRGASQQVDCRSGQARIVEGRTPLEDVGRDEKDRYLEEDAIKPPQVLAVGVLAVLVSV
jgi:hypothetical protein